VYYLDEWIERLDSQEGRAALEKLYPGQAEVQRERYAQAVRRFAQQFGPVRTAIFSAPGRTVLCGEQTDQQHGRVLAAAVTMDTIAVAAPNDTGVINVVSEGYESVDPVALHNLLPQPGERGRSVSLVRGMAARLSALGHNIGGVDAYTTSTLPPLGGLSASAAFEMLLGTLFNHLYNSGNISPMDLAHAGQYVENVYYGKPCGLADQVTSAAGGIISIDFVDMLRSSYDKIETDLSGWDYELCVVDTGRGGADYVSEYVEIITEMARVADLFGCETLRQIIPEDFYARLPKLRKSLPDRALLRAMHFFEENERVGGQIQALREQNAEAFKFLMRASGISSARMLQKAYPLADVSERGLTLALSASDHLICQSGAARIHGGGFSGAIQAFVPRARFAEYRTFMNEMFGPDACRPLYFREAGSIPFEI